MSKKQEMKNKLTTLCFVDDKEDLKEFRKELDKNISHELVLIPFDSSKAEWITRKEKKYLSDTYVARKCKEVHMDFRNKVDFVHFFFPNDKWKNTENRLYGFQLGIQHSTYFVCATRLRSDYEDTAEHETLHAVKNYVKYYLGVDLAVIFGVKDFDRDVVHNPKYHKAGYKYEKVWKKLKIYLDYAVKRKRESNPKINLVSIKERLKPIKSSESIKDPLYKPKNFSLQELVSPKIYEKFGETAWQFLDERMLRNLQHFRYLIGKPVHVNNGADFKYRGFDANEYRKKGTSQHNHGRAIDCHVIGLSAQSLRDFVIKNQASFPEPNMWIEDNVNWLHFDVRHSDKKGVYLFSV